MGKKSRGKRKNPGQVRGPEGWDPRGLEPPSREKSARVTGDIPLGIGPSTVAPWSSHPAARAETSRRAQTVEIPVDVLGPPRDDAERASPALQLARLAGILGRPPGSYERVDPADTLNPPFDPDEPVERVGRADAGAPFVTADPDRPWPPDNKDLDPEAVAVRAAWTPSEVLDAHAWLTERHQRPDEYMLDYLEYYMQDAQAKSRGRAQGMFYPVDLRDVAPGERPPEHKARQLAGHIAHGLSEAVTYEVTAEMVQVMRQVHEKTQEGVAFIDEAELPVPSGFAWLDKPWVISDTNGNFVPVRALTWDLDYAWTDGTDSVRLKRPERIPCARVALWTLMDDDIAFGRWPGAEDRAHEVEGQLGSLTMMHIALLPFGERFGFKDEEHAAKYPESILGLLHTLWMFLGMEIVGQPRAEGITRHVRHRARRSLKHADVRVVILRKIKRAAAEGGKGGAHDDDWSCRWVVQGHWRHIDPYPGERHHAVREVRPLEKHDACGICRAAGRLARVTWIGPYVKGPDGKPLKPVDQRVLYKLAR